MKRAAAIVSLVGLALVWAGLAYMGAAARARDYQDLIRAGDEAIQLDQTFQAIEAYSNAIYLKPDSMLAHLRRGETYQRRGDLEAAARDFQSASDLAPSAVRPLEALGDVRYKQGRFQRAAETYERLFRLNDRAPEASRKLALARFRYGDLEGTIDALDQVRQLGKLASDDYYLQGLALRQLNRTAEAADAFEKAVQLSGDMIAAREELADASASLERHGARLTQLAALADLEQDRPERQIALALAYADGGQVDVAVETLRAALDRAPDRAQIYSASGRIWLDVARSRNDRGALSKALEALERAAPTSGTSSEVLFLYGRALLLAGQVENAERVLLQAIERLPVHPDAFLEHATAAERRGHLDDARRSLILYGALVPDEGDLATRARRIGVLSLRLNRADEAVRWLSRAEAVAPNDISVLTPLADALFRSGDHAAARAIAERGLRIEPTSIALRNVEIRTR